MTPDPVPHRLHAAALAGYAALALAVTWPTALRLGAVAGGAPADVARFVWSAWWWHESLARGVSPLACDVLRSPGGVRLALESWNLPAALVLHPAWIAIPQVSEVALYNAVLLLSLTLAGMSARALCREIWGGELAPFLGAALYVVGAYHLGLATGHVELVSMAASPLFFLGLVRTVRHHGAAHPVIAAVALATVVASSAYHFGFCVAGAAVVLAAHWRADRQALLAPAFLRRALLGAIAFAALAAWPAALLLGPAGAGAPPPGHGASTDLLSFLAPGEASVWRRAAPGATPPAAAGYLGYVALALAGWAAVGAKAARRWLALALLGAVLALGARPQVGSWTGSLPLPFDWLARGLPALRWEGPARFAWLVVFGLAVAATATLSLASRAGRRGPLLAVGLAAVAVVEIWPAGPRAPLPAPRFLRDLSRDTERWVVLDLTGESRQLWNQVLHRHPQAGAPAAYDRQLGAAFPADVGERGGGVPSLRALQEARVRFVIADRATPLGAVARLPRAHVGEGLVVHEVPPAGVTAGVLPRSALAGGRLAD